MASRSTRKRTASVAPDVTPRLLNLKSAAMYLSSTVWFLRTLVWNRQISFLKLGNKYLFDKKDLDAFVERQKVGVRA
jgi:excisionase family DNA binding protein